MNTERLFSENGSPDAYLVVSPTNRYYFTGFKSSFGILLLTAGGGYFATDFRYKLAAEEKIGGSFKLFFGTAAECREYILQAAAQEGVHVIGAEDESLTYAEYEQLQKQFVAYTLVPASSTINRARLVKTPQEIEYISRAEEIGCIAFSKLLGSVKPGVTERDLATELEYLMKKNGGEGTSFDTIVASGANTAMPHAVPTDKKLAAGDIVLFDFGTRYRGYCSDMTRTVCLGKGNDEFKHIYDIVLSANKYAIENIKAGITCREADSFARELITANSYGDKFCHGLGHGVGLDIHEGPTVNKSSDDVLVPNMVITVEPGIYIEGVGGVRIEDVIVVKEDGNVNITSANKEMTIL